MTVCFEKKNNKSKENKKVLNEINEKFHNENIAKDTMLVNLDALKKDNQNTLIYTQFSKLSNQELLYKLENERLEQNEKEIIIKILNERNKK